MPQTVIRVFREVDETVPLEEWLDDLEAHRPKAYHKCLQRILMLSQLGNEMRRPQADFVCRAARAHPTTPWKKYQPKMPATRYISQWTSRAFPRRIAITT